MTEKQIEQLKKMLSETHTTQSTQELDKQIVDAARLESIKLKGATKPPRLGTWLTSLSSFGAAAALTVGVFLGLSQMLSPDDLETNLALKKTSPEGSRSVVIGSDVPQKTPNMVVTSSNTQPNSVPEISLAPSGGSRDEILMRFDPSETQDLLASLSAEFTGETWFDESGIVLAMNDINSLIRVGEFDGARQRYRDFKFGCKDCGLPDALEDLVLAASSETRLRGIKDNTG